jgi:predicted outer membrane repeat protein
MASVLLGLVLATLSACSKPDVPKTDPPVFVSDCSDNPLSCDADGDGFRGNAGDCNDTNPNVFPGAPEACNGLDDDCDEVIDEDVLRTFYADADGDGFGDAANGVEACDAPDGRIPNANDCDDTEVRANPAAAEACDGIDNNCDGSVDEGVRTTFYADVDNDGYGDPNTSVTACEAPQKFVTVAGDCDDRTASIGPGDQEPGEDADGDGVLDPSEDTNGNNALDDGEDLDGDGQLDLGEDLNTNGQLDPGRFVEVCDEIDNDCDGQIDEGVTTRFYADQDRDGHGTAALPEDACSVPNGYATSADDCNDNDANIAPGAPEYCVTDYDDNCNGEVNEDTSVDALVWHRDYDQDGFGNYFQFAPACTPIYTLASEDDPDPDLDVRAEEDSVPAAGERLVAWIDALADHGTDDCNDEDADVHPGAAPMEEDFDVICTRDRDTDGYGDVETPNGIDCVGITRYSLPAERYACEVGGTDCQDDPAWTNPNTDVLYAVSAAEIYPGALEVCNFVDDDCDEDVDEGPIAVDDTITDGVKTRYYEDADDDGFATYPLADRTGTPINYEDTCVGSQSEGFKLYTELTADPYDFDLNDCDEAKTEVNPQGQEVCATDYDDDCDGFINDADVNGIDQFTLVNVGSGAPRTEGIPDRGMFYRDQDGDGWGNPGTTSDGSPNPVLTCERPVGYVEARATPGPEAYTDDDGDGVVETSDGNGVYDYGEPYTDANGNGSYDAGEGCVDANQNDVEDDLEDFTDSNSNGAYDSGEPFVDLNANGVRDCKGDEPFLGDADADGVVDAGEYTDTNGNGRWDGDGSNRWDCSDAGRGAWETNPNNPELCDGVDNDCDGFVDDVDDSFVSRPEICDGEDNDCDGAIDQRDTWVDANANGEWDAGEVGGIGGEYFVDVNRNGVWDADVPEPFTDTNSNTVRDPDEAFTDLNGNAAWDGHVAEWYDDANNNSAYDGAGNATYPGFVRTGTLPPELCDTLDNDCDDAIDYADRAGTPGAAEPYLSGFTRFFVDEDGDGYGSGAEPFTDGVGTDNGEWDTGEVFDDLNGNGVWDRSGVVSGGVKVGAFCQAVPDVGYSLVDGDCDDVDADNPVVVDPRERRPETGREENDGLVGVSTNVKDTIQLGVAAANTGACVYVYGGQYRGTLVLDDAVQLIGVEGAQDTLLDADVAVCSVLSTSDCGGSAVRVTSLGDVRIEGLTITGGAGTLSSSTASTTCANSSPSHAGRNTCSMTTYSAYGGGILVQAGADLALSDVLVMNNDLPVFNSGVSLSSSAADRWRQVSMQSFGGGIAVRGGSGSTVTNVTMDRVTVLGNSAYKGGGIYADGNASVTAEEFLLANNQADYGAGMLTSGASASVTNGIIACNAAELTAGGIQAGTAGRVSLAAVSFYGNTAGTGSLSSDGASAVRVTSGASVDMRRSVVFGASASYLLYGLGAGSVTTSYLFNASGTNAQYGDVNDAVALGTGNAQRGDIVNGTWPPFTAASCNDNLADDDYRLIVQSGSGLLRMNDKRWGAFTDSDVPYVLSTDTGSERVWTPLIP